MAKVFCKKFQKELDAMMFPPLPGEKGEELMQNYSQTAWDEWIKLQTMLINEYRLTPVDPKARKFLEEEMEKFLFGGGSDVPKEFVAPKD